MGLLLRIVQEYETADRIDDAATLLSHILAVAPNQPDASHLAGIIAFRRGQLAEALVLMQRALAGGLQTALYLRNICEVHRILGQLDEAREAALQAAELAPNDVLCLHNLAIIHYHRLELAEAIAVADRALALQPQMPGAHFARAEALLLGGDWGPGWEEYEWRFRTKGAPPLIPPGQRRPGIPQWDGKPLPGGTLLLIADQGFGDVIQFGRYLAWVQQLCPAPIIACSGEVVPMLRQMAPDARLSLSWQDMPPYDAYAALSGLPRLHGTRVDGVPAPIPYLRADPARSAHWAIRLASLVPPGLRRIGLVWAGRPTHNNDRNRSAGLADYAALAAVPGVALIPLQKGPKIDQAGRYFGRAPLINIGAEINDYDDTMAILDNIDLLITVDTSVAHIAGAMGRPVWIMLPHAPDWRWLLDRRDTPWYPTARLFRQSAAKEWPEIVAAMAAELSGAQPRA